MRGAAFVITAVLCACQDASQGSVADGVLEDVVDTEGGGEVVDGAALEDGEVEDASACPYDFLSGGGTLTVPVEVDGPGDQVVYDEEVVVTALSPQTNGFRFSLDGQDGDGFETSIYAAGIATAVPVTEGETLRLVATVMCPWWCQKAWELLGADGAVRVLWYEGQIGWPTCLGSLCFALDLDGECRVETPCSDNYASVQMAPLVHVTRVADGVEIFTGHSGDVAVLDDGVTVAVLSATRTPQSCVTDTPTSWLRLLVIGAPKKSE